MLSPINIKGAAIEGIWPTIRDDDWCGEWQAVERQSQRTAPDAARATFTARSDAMAQLLMNPPPGRSAPPIDALLGAPPVASATVGAD